VILSNDDVDFLAFLGKQESQYVVRPSDVEDELFAKLRGVGPAAGDLLPWGYTNSTVQLRIWGGYNGHGKSLMLGMVAAWGIKVNRWLIASLEMKPAATLLRMVRQAAGTKTPSEEYATKFLRWADDRLWIYDQQDTVQWQRILGMVHYAAQELKCAHVVIDSLMKVTSRGSKEQVSASQIEFVDRLCWAAKSENIHVHLVHHMRKGEGHDGEHRTPGKHDFRGAGEIVDLVDNAFVVHRNIAKDVKRQKGDDYDDDKADVVLKMVKNRHGDGEGVWQMWFHEGALQYSTTRDRRIIPFPALNYEPGEDHG